MHQFKTIDAKLKFHISIKKFMSMRVWTLRVSGMSDHNGCFAILTSCIGICPSEKAYAIICEVRRDILIISNVMSNVALNGQYAVERFVTMNF